MNRYMAAPGIMLLVLLHLQLIFHPLQQPFFLFALLLFLSAVWLMICRRIGMKLTLTLLLILLAAAIIMFPITLDALRVFYNMLLETYRQHSTLYFMSLDTRSVQGSEQLLLAGTMLAFFLIGTLLFHWFIALKRHSRLAFLLLISFLLPCMLHSVPQPPTALILLLVLAALLMDSAQGLSMIMQRRLRMLFMLFACIVPIAVCVLLIPPTQISGSGQGVRDQLLTSLTNLIERITGSGSNDEIDLTQAQDRLYIGSSRGRVLATLEDTYYLKDMSAGVYEDNTWKAIAEEDYVDELGERYDYSRIDTLMSWMNIMGSSSEGMSVTLPSLTIQDMRGDDAHQLIPYHVEDIRGVDDMTFVQDRFIQPAQGDTATFDLIPAPAQYFDPQTYREATAGLDSVLPSYDRFVQQHYTQIPKETAAFFSSLPGLPDRASIRSEALQDVITLIRTYLHDHAEYTLSPGALPNGEDFVEYFLGESHEGYCVHYATAAALLLRYYGYPARYVEGFRVGEEAFSGGIATIRDYDEHAWVEIYDPYLGWIPLEFTESSFDHSQYETGSSSPGEADTPDDPSADPAAPTPVTGDQPSSPDPAQQEQLQVPAAGMLSMAALALLILQPLLRKRWKKKRLHQKDTRKGVLYGYHQLQRMARYGLPIPEEALALANQARFSRSGADEQDVMAMERLIQQTSAKRKQLSVWKRFLFFWKDAC